MRDLESASGRRFGDPDDPLLVSVRSGARFSMPGMMETSSTWGSRLVGPRAGRARWRRFAWDCYRRLVQMYGRTVLGVDPSLFERPWPRTAHGDTTWRHDARAGGRRSRTWSPSSGCILKDHTGEDLPQDPREQLDRSDRRRCSPRGTAPGRTSTGPTRASRTTWARRSTSSRWSTATPVPRSGSGVCFTRDPATGDPVPYGDYLQNAQGEDVVNGSRATVPLADLAEPRAHGLRGPAGHLDRLERHYRDLCDVEFTVEDGRLWILQTRVGKRSPAAAFIIARDLAEEGVITHDEALLRVDGHQLESLLHAAVRGVREPPRARDRPAGEPWRLGRPGRLRPRHRGEPAARAAGGPASGPRRAPRTSTASSPPPPS